MRCQFRIFCVLTLISLSPSMAEEGRISLSLDDATREECLKVLRAGLRGDDFWPSIHAAEGLTVGGRGKEVIEYLTPKLAAETDDQRRCGIVRELVRAGEKSRAHILLEILAKSDDHGHIHAAECLYKLNIIGDGKAIGRAFRQNKNLRLKLMSAAALARKGNADAKAFLRETLSHDDPVYLRTAAWVLGRIGDKSDIARLKQQLPRCSDPVVRATLQHSLAALGDPDGMAALARNLNHADSSIRTYAATFAGDARVINSKDALKKLLKDPNADTRYRAAQSLLALSLPRRQSIRQNKSEE